MLGSAIDVSGFTHDSRAELIEALEEGMEGFVPRPWIVAFGWDPVMMPDVDPPTLAELDALSPNKPFVVLTQMMHVAYANSAALKAAGVTKDTPDPPGAYFGRDENGELDGVVHEINAIDRMPWAKTLAFPSERSCTVFPTSSTRALRRPTAPTRASSYAA
jgi:hypothetical protein